MTVLANIIFVAVITAGIVLLLWDRPWKAIPPVDTDDDGRPTNDYPTAQAFHDLRAACLDLRDALFPWWRRDR